MKKYITLCLCLCLALPFFAADKPAKPAPKAAEASPDEGGGGSEGGADTFKWVRIKYLGTGIGMGGAHDRWDSALDNDLMFLKQLAKYTTVKPEMKVNVATLEKIDEIAKFPVLFMHCETAVRFTDIEVKNMKEYVNRGGFIFADDCVLNEGGGKDLFFQGFKKTIEEKVFPGKKMVLLPIEHEIFHTFFDLPKGLPYLQGPPNGAWGLSDDKGRLMMIAMSTDLHCGWDSEAKYFGEKKLLEAYQMGINIVIYALTH